MIVLTYILSITMHLQNFIKIHQLVHKILSINEISTSIMSHSQNSVENEWKILFNHPNLHLVNINAYIKFDRNPQIHKLIHKILSINKILTSIKGHNSVKNWPKITCIGYNMDFVCTKFYQNSSICSEDIEEKTHFYINQGPYLGCL